MPHNSISASKISRSSVSSKIDIRDIIDLVELLAVLLCIPFSFYVSEYLIQNLNFFFYETEFKMFMLRYLNYYNYSWHFNILQFAFFSVLIIISWYVLSQLTSMSKMPRNNRYSSVVLHFIRGNFFILIGLIGVKYILNLTSIPVIFIITYIFISLLVTLSIRLFTIYKLRIYRSKGYNLRHVMVIADENYIGIIDKLIYQKEWGFKIDSIVSSSREIIMKYKNDIPVYSGINDIKSVLDNKVIDEVLYCKKECDEDEMRNLAEICNEIGVIFRIQSCTSNLDPMQINLKTINQNGKLALVDIPSQKLPLEVKTISDIYLSLIAMIILSPVFLLIILLIKMDSKGPVFFKQERIGLRGRKFKLFKFRTMVVNAEELLEKLKDNNEMDGPTFKIKDDPRVTKTGRFLRKTGMDEFPQLLNVIRGEMSLIGPRPPLESEVKQYERWHLRRLSVKPGITCTWQIKPQRNDIKFEKWMKMDLSYIDNWSLGMDLRLFFQTIRTFFLAPGR